MTFYYLNSIAQKNSEHEVHQLSCAHLPEANNRVLLGKFTSCEEAILKAKEKFHPSKVNGCYHCASFCHSEQKVNDN